MVDIKISPEQIENWLDMPVQVLCSTPRSEQLKTLYHRNKYSVSALIATETQEQRGSQIKGSLQHGSETDHSNVEKKGKRTDSGRKLHNFFVTWKNKIGTDSFFFLPLMGFQGITCEMLKISIFYGKETA